MLCSRPLRIDESEESAKRGPQTKKGDPTLKIKDSSIHEHLKFVDSVRSMNINHVKETEAIGSLNCSLCGKSFEEHEIIYVSLKVGAIICGECSISCLMATRGTTKLVPFKPIYMKPQLALSQS